MDGEVKVHSYVCENCGKGQNPADVCAKFIAVVHHSEFGHFDSRAGAGDLKVDISLKVSD